MAELTERYRLRPSFSVIAHSADVVELRRGVWNPVSITLSDKSASGKLHRALELMDGARTLDDIARQTELSTREAKDLISFLTRHHAIETEPGSAFDSLLDASRGTLTNGAEPQVRFERVVLLGSPELTGDIAQQFEESAGQVPVSTVPTESLAALAEKDLTLSEDPLAFRDELAAYDAWKGGLVVAASLTINPILLRNINRICLHVGVPWLHAAADGPFLLIGPTFVPGRSACYECFETRVSMSMRENESYIRYKRALANRAIRIGTPHIGRPFRGVLTSLTALEVANLLASGSNFTIGKALAIFLPALGFTFNEVLRVPGCAACSPITEQHEQSLYFDLRGYVNSLYAPSNGGPNGGPNGSGAGDH